MRTRAILTGLALAAAAIPAAVGHSGLASSVAGVPADKVGIHGPTEDYAEGLQLVGHSALLRTDPNDGTVKPSGNNAAPALIGTCAYVGRWHDYTGIQPVQIVDIDPGSATFLQVVGDVPGSNIEGAVSREIRAIDLPSGFRMLTVMTFSKFLGDSAIPGLDKLLFFTFAAGAPCTEPTLVGQFDISPFKGHEFFQWLDPNPAHNVDGHPRILEYVTTPISGTDVIVVDASRPSAPRLIGVWNAGLPLASARETNLVRPVPVGLGTYSHSISLSPDGREAYISHWDGGFFTVDTSDFADALPAGQIRPKGAMSVPVVYPPFEFGNTHTAVRIPGSGAVVIGDEIYVTTDGCPFGWMRVMSTGDATTPPSQIGEFRLPENQRVNCSGLFVKDTNALGLPIDGTFSIHNQTVTPHYVLTSWYGGGLRVIDVTNPAAPTAAAFFVPKPAESVIMEPDTTAPTWGRNRATTDDDWRVQVWSYPILRKGADGVTYIYVTDTRSGLYVLRAAPGTALAAELDGIGFLEGNSNLGDFR